MSAETKKKWIKTLKFLAAYLVAAWTFLQFVDWVLNRYNISPYWVDILLWFFIGITPSLLIYFYHQERLTKRIIKLREKILIPLNIIILAIGLYFGFGSSDLGATTKEIKYTDEDGKAQSETITKEEFRIGVPIYGFDNLSNDESLDWMRYGIGKLLTEDLHQNKSLSPDFYFYTDTSTKIEESSLFNDFYNNVLFSIYGETKQTEKFLKSSQRLFSMDQNPDTGFNLARAAMVSGSDDMLINEIENYEIISPILKVFKIQPLLFKKEYKKAEKLLKNTKTLYPYYKYRAQVFDSALVHLKAKGYDISEYKKFEGAYRSGNNERVQYYWIENDRMIQYFKNQTMDAYVPAGKNAVVSGFINNTTYRTDFILGDNDKPIGLNFSVVNYNNIVTIWYWKEDDIIKQAHEAFDNGKLDEAERLYTIAIQGNPKHTYLNNYLSHLIYIKERDTDTLIAQHKKFIGSYGPRKFWIEDNKFYYKRKSETVDLPRLELLAINENTYMDATRPNTLMVFETNEKGNLASTSHSFNLDTWKYEQTVEGNNYLEKDK